MSSSKALGSVVVGSERSEGWGAALFVVPAGGGEGEESLKDAGGDAGEAAGGVPLEVELRFEGCFGSTGQRVVDQHALGEGGRMPDAAPNGVQAAGAGSSSTVGSPGRVDARPGEGRAGSMAAAKAPPARATKQAIRQ